MAGQPLLQSPKPAAQPGPFPYAGEWVPGHWLLLTAQQPPLLKATFDETPEKLAFFLNQVQSHPDWFGQMYPDKEACVEIIVENLEGEIKQGVVNLHDKGAPKLGDLAAFLGELRAQFSNPTQPQRAEAEVQTARQVSRPVAKYIREFRRIAERLRNWPEGLLTQYFQKGLGRDLFHLCLARGILDRLND